MLRCRFLLLALLAGLVVSLPMPAGETVSAEKINKLIEQMGSGTFAEREKASKELDAIGVPALERSARRPRATTPRSSGGRRNSSGRSKNAPRALDY